MTLETQVNEISPASFAKTVAPYLKITIPEVPKTSFKYKLAQAAYSVLLFPITAYVAASDFIFHRKEQKEEKMELLRLIEENAKDDAEYELELNDLGLLTREEKDAYAIAQFAGMALRRFIRYAYTRAPSNPESGIVVEQELLEDYLKRSINDGIMVVRSEYAMPGNTDDEVIEIVNPEFKERAFICLKEEIYFKTEEGLECKVLEVVAVKRDADRYLLK